MRSTVSGEAEAAAARVPAGGVLWGPSAESGRTGGRDGCGIRAFEYRARIRLPVIDTVIFICSAPYGLNPTGGPVSGSNLMVATCARRPKAVGVRLPEKEQRAISAKTVRPIGRHSWPQRGGYDDGVIGRTLNEGDA